MHMLIKEIKVESDEQFIITLQCKLIDGENSEEHLNFLVPLVAKGLRKAVLLILHVAQFRKYFPASMEK